MPLCTLLLLSLDGGHASIDAAFDSLRNETAPSVEILTVAHVHRPTFDPHASTLASSTRPSGTSSSSHERSMPNSCSTLSHSDELASRPAPALSSLLDQLPASLRSGVDGKPRDSQHLEVSDDLLRFADELERKEEFRHRPVVMLNLLQFQEGKHESYKQYGKGFVTIGSRHGGVAKLVGLVVAPPAAFASDSRGDKARPSHEWWNEAAYAFYPSIRHFVDMAANSDYQEINQRFRLPSLRDTTIICTTELDWGHAADKSALSSASRTGTASASRKARI
ncbi:hypothetical protein CF328_g7361 [Tilletia controversa]|nr:hypothetical protein CF328_g7361 [Tilletia controversa]